MESLEYRSPAQLQALHVVSTRKEPESNSWGWHEDSCRPPPGTQVHRIGQSGCYHEAGTEDGVTGNRPPRLRTEKLGSYQEDGCGMWMQLEDPQSDQRAQDSYPQGKRMTYLPGGWCWGGCCTTSDKAEGARWMNAVLQGGWCWGWYCTTPRQSTGHKIKEWCIYQEAGAEDGVAPPADKAQDTR